MASTGRSRLNSSAVARPMPELAPVPSASGSVAAIITKADGTKVNFTATARIDTPVEVDYYRNGGILHTVVRNIARAGGQ